MPSVKVLAGAADCAAFGFRFDVVTVGPGVTLDVGAAVGLGVRGGLVGAGVTSGVGVGFGLWVAFGGGARSATPFVPSPWSVAIAGEPKPAANANATANDATQALLRYDTIDRAKRWRRKATVSATHRYLPDRPTDAIPKPGADSA